MIYILEYEKISENIIDACGNIGIANILSIIKSFLDIIQIIGPILCMVALAINFTKLMTNPDEKKFKAGLKNSLIALVILFMVPFIINLTMSLADGSFDLATCWNNAEKVSTLGEDSNYVETSDKQKDNIDMGGYNTENAKNETNTQNNQQITKTIFVGDSRTVGMELSVADDPSDVWSSKGSMGLSWMKSTGIPNIESEIKSGSAVVILMGVNDLYKKDQYISYLNENSAKWKEKGAQVYFVSVNPTEGSYSNLNDDIDSFNQKLRSNLTSNIKYIDCNSYLKSNGFSTTDGLHYTTDTYNKIYNYIKSNL